MRDQPLVSTFHRTAILIYLPIYTAFCGNFRGLADDNSGGGSLRRVSILMSNYFWSDVIRCTSTRFHGVSLMCKVWFPFLSERRHPFMAGQERGERSWVAVLLTFFLIFRCEQPME